MGEGEQEEGEEEQVETETTRTAGRRRRRRQSRSCLLHRRPLLLRTFSAAAAGMIAEVSMLALLGRSEAGAPSPEGAARRERKGEETCLEI